MTEPSEQYPAEGSRQHPKDTAPARRPSMARTAAAGSIGTVIEYYDFFIYGSAAALVFGPVYFPNFSSTAGTLAAFATFATGFIARPVGSLLFGHIGDRHGRRTVLLISVLTTGLATVCVGLLPGYDTLGLAAPLLLTLMRVVQGLGLGGEWAAAVLLVSEHAPPARRGLWASFPQTGPSVGFVLANGVMLSMTATLTDEQFHTWGWRVPFLCAGVLTLVGYLLRSKIDETPAFLDLTARRTLVRAPLARLMRHHWRRVLLVAGAVTAAYAVNYAATTWALSQATGRLGLDPTVMLFCLMGAMGVMGLATPLVAVLGDRYGRRRLSLVGCGAMALCIVPYLAMLQTGQVWMILAGTSMMLLAVITMLGVQGAYIPELFEPELRCTGTAFAYNIGAVLGGALTPLIATRLATTAPGLPWGVAGYLLALCALSSACFVTLPDTRKTGCFPGAPSAVRPTTADRPRR
ncbi:MFS transporter [Streptomyces lunaelactis]|uniref:MFS transporter n=1 Tax=Streptomyces lunaelactis TaxID=1535768 RepID=UPI002816098F|nr:MFS transporter [Streptomyces lunaelactis]